MAIVSPDDRDIEVFSRADMAMYQVKHRGGNRVCVYAGSTSIGTAKRAASSPIASAPFCGSARLLARRQRRTICDSGSCTPGQHWSNCDEDIHAFLLQLAAECKRLLARSLWQSICMGRWPWDRSGVPPVIWIFSASAGRSWIRALRAAVADGLMDFRIDARSTAISRYPSCGKCISSLSCTPRRTRCTTAPSFVTVCNPAGRWTPMCSVDRDLAAHCQVLRARGVVLEGPPIHSVIGQVPRDAYVDALLYDLADILNGSVLLDAPVYGILNCCRILAALGSSGPGVMNKEEGGVWGLAHMERQHRILVGQALEVQRGRWPVSPQHRNTGGLRWNREAVVAFRDYVAARGRVGCSVHASLGEGEC